MAWFVNGEQVDDEAVREEARSMRPRYMESIGPMDPIEAEMQLREWARENVIERMLLKAAALTDPEPVPAEVIDQGVEAVKNEAGGKVGCGSRNSDGDVREQVETQYRLERLLARVQSQVKLPKPKEVAEHYRKNKEHFTSPALVHAAHIVRNVDEQNDEASARAAIEVALAELEAGSPFPEVADRHSDCPGNGGDLGWFGPGEMVEEFEQVVFSMQPGERSDIFRSGFGFHIATVLERRPAGLRPLKEIEGHLTEAMMATRRTKAVEDFIDQLRARAEIRQGKAAQ